MIDESELGKTIDGKTPEQWQAEFRARRHARTRRLHEKWARERALRAEAVRSRGLLGWLGLR